MLNRLAGRYGWRGLWLMLMGVMWIAFGIGVAFEPPAARSWVLYEYVPVVGQAAGWLISGGIALFVGLRGGRRKDDALGHVALYVMPAVRLMSFLLSWVIFLGSTVAADLGWITHEIGYSRGWYAALIWSLVSLMLAIGAGWPNPDPPILVPPVKVN